MHHYSRRDAIQLALTGFILSPFGCTPSPPRSSQPDSSSKTAQMTSSLQNTIEVLKKDRKRMEHAKHCGTLWLEQQKPRPTIADLEARFSPLLSGTSEEMRRAFQQQHKRDIKDDRLVSVTGWLLTETETHLYAMFTLLEA